MQADEQQDALLSTTLSTTLLWLVQLTRAFVLKPKQGEVGAGLSHGPFPALPFSMPFASPAEQMVLIFFFYFCRGSGGKGAWGHARLKPGSEGTHGVTSAGTG